MNKKAYIEKIKNATNYDEDKCIKINDILESHFIVGKKGKERIINDFVEQVNMDREEAEKTYEVCVSLLGTNLKKKIRHPFKSNE